MKRKTLLTSGVLVAALTIAGALIRPALSQLPPADGLKNIVVEGAKLEKVSSGLIFTEGPLYDTKMDTVIFSDQPSSRLMVFNVKTGKTDTFRDAKVTPNGNTFDTEHRLVSCEHATRRISRTDKDGRIVTLVYLYNGKRLNSPNDLCFAKDGSLYFTDPPYGLPNQSEGKEQEFNGVYRLDTKGNVTLLVSDFDRPNGIALSPDEKTIYVNDTNRGHVRAFDRQPDGTLTNGRIFATLKAEGKRGAPDGMKVDTLGNVYSTGAGGVWVVAPDGKILGVIETPETAANCGFGDKDGKTLYITASTGLYRIRLKVAGPIPDKR